MMMYVGLRIVEKLYLFRYEIELCAVKKSRRFLDPVCFRLSCTSHKKYNCSNDSNDATTTKLEQILANLDLTLDHFFEMIKKRGEPFGA